MAKSTTKPLRAPTRRKPAPTPDIVELTDEQAAQQLLNQRLREREMACRDEIQQVMARHGCVAVIERREFSDGQPPQYLIHYSAQQ